MKQTFLEQLQEVVKTTQPTEQTPIDAMLQTRIELSSIVEEAQELLQQINVELLNRVKLEGQDELIVGDNTIKRIERVSFTYVPLEFAKKFRAVKKVVDGDVLKPLYKKGIIIPNVKVSEYITVKGGEK